MRTLEKMINSAVSKKIKEVTSVPIGVTLLKLNGLKTSIGSALKRKEKVKDNSGEIAQAFIPRCGCGKPAPLVGPTGPKCDECKSSTDSTWEHANAELIRTWAKNNK